jgi:hypothetical protein
MRSTTLPSASTSKSSCCYWPDGRDADARLRISDTARHRKGRGIGDFRARFLSARGGMVRSVILRVYYTADSTIWISH